MSSLAPKILIVDDVEDQVAALQIALRGHEWEIQTAASGKEGIDKVCGQDFAAIVLDVHMPTMDGFETALWMRAHGINTPIIFVSGHHTTPTDLLRGYEAGAVDYMHKPVNFEALRAKISVLVGLYRKQRDTELQSALIAERAERRFRDLVEGIPNGFVWTGIVGTGSYNYVSASAERISGFKAEEWLSGGRFMMANCPPDDRQVIEEAVSSVLQNGGDSDFEHRFIRADGRVIWLRTNVRITDLATHQEYRGLSVDITPLKQTERHLREAIMSRDEFLVVAAHELRTPMTPLKLQIEGFRRLSARDELARMPAEKLNRMLEVSAAQVDILDRLVNQLLDVSRARAGNLSLNRESLDLVRLVKSAVDVMQASHETEIRVVVPAQLHAECDGIRIEQVLVNLLDNAIKYGLGRPIEVRLSEEGSFANFSVQDSGLGIAPGAQERIFQRFERAVSPNHFSGIGLGLYITRQIIELHGGNITVQSQLGQGSTFTARIPKQAN